jgi:UDP-N-acetylmuramoyl-tripeptide--D-alanyl-D-alanine ligase
MNIKTQKIFDALEKCNFSVSTDTRKDISGTIFFALKGENFDGNQFVHEALKKGATGVVTENSNLSGENIYVVDDVLQALNSTASKYRDLFKIPIIAIGGSNGKTTSKDLVRDVLRTKYKVLATEGSLNNHFGVPLSILSMTSETEMAVLEIGANHQNEHTDLLKIIKPTHVVVTNNGMDHLEGFGSPIGARKANKEIYDWAKLNNAKAFVNKNLKDLMEGSTGNIRILYPEQNLETTNSTFVKIKFADKEYVTNLVGKYNTDNIELALSIGKHFNVSTEASLEAISLYKPLSKRSQLLKKNGVAFVVDCYNANPTSMHLSVMSFLESSSEKKGVVVGDMLELGSYSEEEHEKILKFLLKQKLDCLVFIGQNFKKALSKTEAKDIRWFIDSEEARNWFSLQKFNEYTFLLKGSRGIKVEKILEF